MSDAPPPPPYGADPQQPATPPYGAPQYPAYGPTAPDHPQATTILVLGILGIVVCGVLAPFAWVMGNRALAEIDASHGRMGGRGSVQAGRICGIVGTVLLGLGLLMLAFFVVLAVGGAMSSGY